MNFYPFHIGDYLAHTSHLNDAEDLAYRRMMDWYYLNEKPLPADIDVIARLVRATPEIVIMILGDFFYQDENPLLGILQILRLHFNSSIWIRRNFPKMRFIINN